MHGEQYRYSARTNDEQHHQPSTSSPHVTTVHHQAPIQANLMLTPTSSALPTTPSTSGGGQRVRIGQPIRIGDNILQPAGTLVFSQTDGATWSGQRVLVQTNKHAVVQANLFPIGTAPLIGMPAANGNWYLNQQPMTSTATSRNPTTASSATPDSGIQSVPTSPPSPSFELMNDRLEEEDDDDGPADFTDMPTLKPADEDDCYDMPSTSAGPSHTEVNTPTTTTPVPPANTVSQREELPNGMNAEEFLTLSIERNMDPDEIVKRLIAFDPEKASSIAVLIKKRCAESKKKKESDAEVSSTTPTTPRVRSSRKRNHKNGCTRNTNSPDVTTSTEEPSTSAIESDAKSESKKRGRKPKRKRLLKNEEEEVDEKKIKPVSPQPAPESSEPSTSSRPQSSVPPVADPVQFRLKVHEMMERQLEQATQKMSEDMSELRLSHATAHKGSVGGKRKESFLRQLAEQSKKIKKGQFGKRMRLFEEEKPCEKAEEETPKVRSRLPSRRTREPSEALTAVEEKFNGEYYEISKSVPSSDAIIPLWRAPSLTCGCTKGACTSDMDCLNRALRVQCNSDCTLSYCSNRRFWKEDNNKLCVSNGPRTKRALKTKVARRAGEFLCEYAGEVIEGEEARRRFSEKEDARIIAIGSQLFVDATSRGNIARFVKHSCRPNSRLEVWSVNGVYRAGVFALVDLGTNVEITVDKSGLLPSDQQCTCSVSGCKKWIRGARIVPNYEPTKTTRFLPRNCRKVRSSGLPSILTSEELPSPRLQMKKVLAAFAFRVRRIDGSMERSMLPYYTDICRFLKTEDSNLEPAEFVGFFRKWLEVIDDDDLERAFIAIESHYMSSSLLSSAQQLKKSKENAQRARAPSTSCHSPVLAKRGDADLSYLDAEYAIGSYDPDEAWESYRANTSDNAVRCICGALDEDGEMVQCDGCHFWLHIDCCAYDESAQDEYKCYFCVEDKNRPCADVKLTAPLDVRFENCDYYRSLVNRRGIQVRLNETVYVNRVLPEDHKGMLRNLREEKKGVKASKPNRAHFPDAPTTPIASATFDRREARIFRVERLFVCPGNNRFVFGSFYAWPHETYADTGRVFSKKEVFATPYYETLPLDEVIGRCLVVDTNTWSKGRPKVPKFKEEDVFLCEMQIGKNQRVFEKVPPKNRYPINTQPYVFTKFNQTKKIVRDFRPYDPSNPPPKPPKTPNPVPADSLPELDTKKMSMKNIDKVLERLCAKKH